MRMSRRLRPPGSSSGRMGVFRRHTMRSPRKCGCECRQFRVLLADRLRVLHRRLADADQLRGLVDGFAGCALHQFRWRALAILIAAALHSLLRLLLQRPEHLHRDGAALTWREVAALAAVSSR